MRKVKCNKCGYIGEKETFKMDRDFFQNSFISGCPKCDNHQSPGDASMRMFGGERPFVYVDFETETGDALSTVLNQAAQAS